MYVSQIAYKVQAVQQRDGTPAESSHSWDSHSFTLAFEPTNNIPGGDLIIQLDRHRRHNHVGSLHPDDALGRFELQRKMTKLYHAQSAVR